MPSLVTIGIPVYKRLDYVAQAVRSVEAQTYPHIELIVSDNGQIGAALTNIVEANYSRRLLLRRNPQTVPICPHFNQLIDAATGDYYIHLSDDDEISPNFVEELLARVEPYPNVAVGIGRVEAMNDVGVTYASTDDKPLPPPLLSAADLLRTWSTHFHNYITFTTFLARTDELRAVGKWPDFHGGNQADNGMLLRLILGREVAFNPAATFRHRIHNTSFGMSVSLDSLALASRQFLHFLDSDPVLRTYAQRESQVWSAMRQDLRDIIWKTYFTRWMGLYRERVTYAQWLRSGFALPLILPYYRQVVGQIAYSLPVISSLARNVRRIYPRAS